MVQIAVIGDIHTRFTAVDVAHFNAGAADLILVVGDLSNYRQREGYPATRCLARLRKPTLFIPGNHDAVLLLQLLAEARGIAWLADLLAHGQARRAAALRRRLGPVTCCGYSGHPFALNGQTFDVIAARPYAFGGSALSCRRYLRRAFGVGSLADSAEKLKGLVDTAVSDRLIFLAHNGPAGLGAQPHDIWGCDFRDGGGDYGDADLQTAVAHAQARGKQVLAVVAGHMHHRVRGGGRRAWLVERDGVVYVNAARTPRIFKQGGRTVHHHVRLTLDAGGVTAGEQVIHFPE
jgi:uncharacterized protein (TIGR04168 family)